MSEKRILQMVAPSDPRLLTKIAPYQDDMLKEHDFKDRKELADAMYDTMKKYGGLGLSCNQVGLPYRMFVMGGHPQIDLAILFTWREIAKLKNSTNTNLLILDEIFDSSLDSSGTDEFMRILYTTMDKENVFVISHKGDTLIDKFPRVMKFEKYKNFTRMVE